jgi:hypothetical protein
VCVSVCVCVCVHSSICDQESERGRERDLQSQVKAPLSKEVHPQKNLYLSRYHEREFCLSKMASVLMCVCVCVFAWVCVCVCIC